MTSRTTYNGNDIDKTIPFTRECYTVITDEDYQPLPEMDKVASNLVEIRGVIDRLREASDMVEDLDNRVRDALINGKPYEDLMNLRSTWMSRLKVRAQRVCRIEEIYQ